MKRWLLLFLLFVVGWGMLFAWPAHHAYAFAPEDAPPAHVLTPLQYDHPTTPERLIGSYVNAINRLDYEKASQYWESPPDPQQLRQRFLNTRSVMAIIRPPIIIQGAAGSSYAYVPTLWLERKNNGHRVAYYACFTARRSNMESQTHPTHWYIYDAEITSAPNAGGWLFFRNACPDAQDIVDQASQYDNRTTPERLIATYFDAINRGQYERAYKSWVKPPVPYDEFVSRFQHIRRIDPLIRVPVWVYKKHGHRYARVHFLQLVTYKSGLTRAYDACFTVRLTPGNQWKIVKVHRKRVANGSGWWLAHRCW